MLLVLLYVLLLRSSVAGDLDLARAALFPLARRNQDGFDFGAGLPAVVRSDEDAKDVIEPKEDREGGVAGAGLATSA